MRFIFYGLILFLCFFSHLIPAQNLHGIAHSNYAGTNGIFFNPASIADSRHSFYINLATFDAHVGNSRFSWNGPSLLPFVVNNEEYKDEYLKEASSGKVFSAGVDVRAMNMLFRLNQRSSFALGARARVLFSGNNVSDNIFSLIKTDLDKLENQAFNNASFNLNVNAMSEYSLTYAREVFDKGKHYLKGGLTFKYLIGGVSGQINAGNLNYEINDNPNNINENIVRLNQLSSKIAYSRNNLEDFEGLDLANGSQGSGIGFDLGAIYEFRPDVDDYTYQMDGENRYDNRKNKYKYRISFSLMDIGGVRYKTDSTRFYEFNSSNRTITAQDLEDISNLDDFAGKLGVNTNDFKNNFRASLPTTVNVSFDYRLAGKLYANASLVHNLRGQNATGMRQNSMFAITPRFETGGFEVALPLNLQSNYSKFAVGLALKLGPLRIGSDNLGAILNLGNPHGANVYFGLGFGFMNKKRIQDKDEDGISDKQDECPDVRGLLKFKGCPDTDEDGIQDKEDDCPNEAGKAEFKGCPDTDNDGIPDKEDNCPQKAGKPEFKGCPDTDEDGIIDEEDACPQVAGKLEFKGCPDSDNDGIQDSQDECPQAAGKAEFKGCPDTDNDGIQDSQDLCPTEYGKPEFKGCPDRDADGIPDRQDACPDQAGLKINNGCPEIKTNEPVLTAEEKEVLKEAFDNLEFETGKAVIVQKSLESLKELAEVLKKRPEYRLQISGHTDNVGIPANNLKLSKDRANAVKIFLNKNGIDNNRLIAEGFGSTKPLVDNKTPEGRQRNRRVEMKIIK
jgi:outer membrane protein OmpA-like peptidoglycan-associated protein